jgi:hypothetical protein
MLRVASLFSQLLSKIPRDDFARAVKETNAEHASKGFTCWTQLVAMLFCQLARADSLREICNGLASCQGKLVHLGVDDAPNKSTLSYANGHRPAELYEKLFWLMAERFRSGDGLGTRKTKFRFKNKLLSLDSTTITLCLSLFPWADYRRTKGGVKLHVLLDHDDYMPSYLHLTDARQHDVKAARLLSLVPGSIVAMDRGYNDYELFGRWSEQGVFFVTRLKDNAVYEVIEQRTVPEGNNILSDQVIELRGSGAEDKCPWQLRRICVWDADNQREIVLLTNHPKFAASTISAIYRDRWEIELFFKALKQNLKVKTFVGTSENALRIQIWTALIALLILKWLHHLSRAAWSLSNLAAMLRMNLFTYRDLMQWLHNPFGTPPIVPDEQQLSLQFAGVGQHPVQNG